MAGVERSEPPGHYVPHGLGGTPWVREGRGKAEHRNSQRRQSTPQFACQTRRRALPCLSSGKAWDNEAEILSAPASPAISVRPAKADRHTSVTGQGHDVASRRPSGSDVLV